MSSYVVLKTLHILSATFLWGTGVGTAFFMLMAYLSGDIATLRNTTKHVVLADWLFTAPTLVIQPVSGYLLMQQLGLPLSGRWLALVAGLYALTVVCWLPVARIQLQMQAMMSALPNDQPLPAGFHRLFWRWFALGVPAAAAMLLLFFLMVDRPWIPA